MYGNTPYAGMPEGEATLDAGDPPDLTGEQRRSLQEGVADIAALTREFLPEEYVVGGQVEAGVNGWEVTVAVQPPVGHPVSAGFEPEVDADDPIPAGDRREVARGLAASAALQVKQAMGDEVPQAAR
ncbi:MAG: DUF5811 family protein [Halobacteriaceae archaeon]